MANGIPHEIDDRIGGIMQILGQPGSPVVLTSLRDDRHAAGTRPDGDPQTRHQRRRHREPSPRPRPGDWNSIRLDRYSHDRNVGDALRIRSSRRQLAGPQRLAGRGPVAGHPGAVASSRRREPAAGVHRQGLPERPERPGRLQLQGAFPAPRSGSTWTAPRMALDPMVELLDGNGNVVARSNSSLAKQ